MFRIDLRTYLRHLPVGALARTAKAAVLSTALRATIAVLSLIGRHLSLDDAERQTILVRVQAALLGARA